ncbi:aminoglycoside phosphotransferase family protein [Plantactinospora sp. KLBMP9567]|uniref:phosphotransferase enzyme family protein n=1 Tax=Plantactinospora sp. KLBMP9567 TaxID=3085900 RepID=UPI0029822D62|nr:aminoglycoside phosphotransferase family protein [Plantactinospora sp. KLBMP9567]MDW5325620.1 aminoglycoside phosphotransferase family protein [Plantactinospora sp. KLBMP9567]
MNAALAPLDQLNARMAVVEACRSIGLDPTDAELVRLGENAIFRLLRGSIVARVARSAARLPNAEREIRISRWLQAEGIPVIRALELPQPILAQGRVVVLWESAADAEAYGTTAELGDILRRLHGLTLPAELSMPLLHPVASVRRRIAALSSLPEDDQSFLRARCEALDRAHQTLTFELPPGVVHGDANVGNLLRGWDGQAILADLDGFGYGTREWDLVLTAMYYERYGWHTLEEYQEFADAYGYDLLPVDCYRTLADLRELIMVAWLAQNASHDPKAMNELAKRLATLRTGTGHRDWQPF